MVPEGQISEILADSPDDPETPARRLLSPALDAGGTDNVTVVVVDVREQEVPRGEGSGDTHEMPAVAWVEDREENPTSGRSRPSAKEHRGDARSGPRRPKKARLKRKRSGAFVSFVRGLAVVLVVVVALTPAYLWGASRYFLGLEGDEVVAYRGLPYAPLGVELNEQWRRTDVDRKSTRLNSSHANISYAVFCLKK